MPKKEKKGGKKKGKENDEKVTEKKEEIKPGNWLKLHFVLLEDDWNFADHDLFVEAGHQILYITQKIRDFHGKVVNIQFFHDRNKQNKLTTDFRITMEQIFKDAGAATQDQAKKYTIYYCFDLDIDTPLLNYDNFTMPDKLKPTNNTIANPSGLSNTNKNFN